MNKIIFKGFRFKNRRVEIAEIKDSEGDGFLIRFKRLINKDEIKEFEENPTCRMKLNKNLVTTEIKLSEKAGFSLMLLLQQSLNKKIKKKLFK